MLEEQQAIQHDIQIKLRPSEKRIDRKKGRSYVYGYSENGIDKLDLSHTENLAASDGAFAARLERAIEEGLEHDIAVTIDEPGTERPTQMIVPRVHLPEQIPAVPARMQHVAATLSELRSEQCGEDESARQAERADQRMIAPGRLTVLDLRAGACHFSESESAPYFFCGAPTGANAKPWCPEHHLVCFPRRL